MIEATNISKYFGSFCAVDDVSFRINQGDIIGFLGQNGAGKTTLMRILTQYLPPTSGTVRIDGQEISRHSLVTRREIGYLPETPPLYPQLTVLDYLRFIGRLRDIPARRLSQQVERVLTECDLAAVRHKVLGTLSKGYRQRVGIAQAIIHEPAILILDEPTNGLDPVQIQHVRRLIRDLQSHRTVILSTHILSEIERLAQRILMIQKGRIIVDEKISNLLAASEVPGVRIQGTGDHALWETAIQQAGCVERCTLTDGDDGSRHCHLKSGVNLQADTTRLMKKLLEAGLVIISVQKVHPSLEDIFLQKVGPDE